MIAEVELSSQGVGMNTTLRTHDVVVTDDTVDDAGGLTLYTATTTAPGLRMDVPRLTQLSVIKTVVLSIMFVVALIANSATLARMYRMRRRRSTINLLLTHLATADLFVTFFCNVTEAVWTSTVQWLAGNAACKIMKFLQVFNFKASSLLAARRAAFGMLTTVGQLVYPF